MRTLKWSLSLAVVALSACASGPSSAKEQSLTLSPDFDPFQSIRLRVGALLPEPCQVSVVGSELNEASRRDPEGRRLETIAFECDVECSESEFIHLRASSSQFDTVLYVSTPSGEIFDSDDAYRASSSGSALKLVPERGEYLVSVVSYWPEEQGTYRLEMAVDTAAQCSNACPWRNDGECDDGRAGAVTNECALGTDTVDCVGSLPAPPGAPIF